MMSRFAFLLLIAVMASAIYLVRVQYQSRVLFTAQDHAMHDAQQLATEHDRLEAQRRAAATSLRVEQIASAQLAMRPITPAITDYVAMSANAPASAPARAASAAAPRAQRASAAAHAAHKHTVKGAQ